MYVIARPEFTPSQTGGNVRVTFDSESTYSIEQQRQGWQSILNNSARHVEANRKSCRISITRPSSWQRVIAFARRQCLSRTAVATARRVTHRYRQRDARADGHKRQ
jgi:hypothetical protein